MLFRTLSPTTVPNFKTTPFFFLFVDFWPSLTGLIDREESRHHPLTLASKATHLLNSRKVEIRMGQSRDTDWPIQQGKGRGLDPDIYKGLEIRKKAAKNVTRIEVEKTLSGRFFCIA
ncbi:hypothetical protein AVEN_36643-1 [Araneus ventricosus]|uniref:Uncharacterized protein n=1 Tax=Araneus ventricosus TaxID=182803 RepID=A0A4Y2FVU9_ARAVE|nr:hypothetical protein AVEN_36643-1 [Araneus ventricosus]